MTESMPDVNERPAEFIAALNDPVAEQTEWTPLKTGGANFRTHELVEVSSSRLEFRSTFTNKVLPIVIALVGMGSLAGGMYYLRTAEHPFTQLTILLLPIGLIFSVIGVVGYLTDRPRVFDLDSSLYWEGKQPGDDSTPLDQIHAIQILRERIKSHQQGYTSYELNLVLQEGSRINVIDHGDINAIKPETARLAGLLGVPVWDASQHAIG